MYYDKLNAWDADNYAYDWDNKSPALHVLLTQVYPSETLKCDPSPHLKWQERTAAYVALNEDIFIACGWDKESTMLCAAHTDPTEPQKMQSMSSIVIEEAAESVSFRDWQMTCE